jgi:regulator of nucleoside diphosphate kinase
MYSERRISTMNQQEMSNRIIVTVNDYQRLMKLLASVGFQTPEIVSRLQEKLSAAKTMAQEEIDRNIVTMNSRIRIKDLTSNKETEITITYPQDAAPRARRVSVVSEIGLALLGRQEQATVSWGVPNGVGLFEIAKITYQPEAAGDYSL